MSECTRRPGTPTWSYTDPDLATTWEYRELRPKPDEDPATMLNELGKEGWELCVGHCTDVPVQAPGGLEAPGQKRLSLMRLWVFLLKRPAGVWDQTETEKKTEEKQ